MPPKNKKDAEEQAKRLEQQRKKRQEEEARLELQRKKYLHEVLPTGLFLPASAQLVIEFPNKPVEFVAEKLRVNLQEGYQHIVESKKWDFYRKQLLYLLKDSLAIYGPVKEGDQAVKHRVFIGIVLAVMLNNTDEAKGEIKDQTSDEKKAKQLVTIHCQKSADTSYLSKQNGLAVLDYLKSGYFSRYQLINNFDRFPKRHTQHELNLYIETPNIYLNNANETFTNYSKPAEQNRVS